ncbi:MAG: epoxide hydrolase family protein [Pseudomonadota bacterium]
MEQYRFNIEVSREAIDDLHARLDRARWPDELPGTGWQYGMPKGLLREMASYWRNAFDVSAAIARINAFDQYRMPLAGLDLHFIHQRSPHAGATPLLLVHGWPGSIVEFLDVIPRLTQPELFGGRAEDAFHVICPSLPGYGYSAAPPGPGCGPRYVAQRHLALMTALGYERFVAQGGDWGAVTCRLLPDLAPERLIGLHLNLVAPVPPADVPDPAALCTQAEQAALATWQRHQKQNMGYVAIQASRPQTLAYGLADSPVGLLAWIGEKFHEWADHGGDLRDAVSRDALLTNVSLYWFSNSIGSSLRLYQEHFAGLARGEGAGPRVDVPFGAAIYPGEFMRPPKAWIERTHRLVHWFEAERGGHFAAMEQPDIFARDLWRFHGTLRGL